MRRLGGGGEWKGLFCVEVGGKGGYCGRWLTIFQLDGLAGSLARDLERCSG